MKTGKSRNIRDLFVKGELSGLYKLFQKKDFEKGDRPWIVATLCLLGKVEEAQSLIKGSGPKSFDYFFLTMALTRKGEYILAKNFLKKLYQNRNLDEESNFFYYQAMSFYSYFHCRYRISLTFAKRAHLISMHLGESFWKILALDLLGYNQLQMGDIHQGIYHLEEAQSLAKILGNKAFEQATSVSILAYRSQYSLQPVNDAEAILKMLKKISRTDNYSEGLLTMSLAHLYLLLGQMQLADKYLLKAQSIIFGHNISRHIGAWHFERAYFYYLQGRLELALNELNLALDQVNKGVDLRLELKILGLKRQILITLNEDVEALNIKVIYLTKKIGHPSSVNKLARDGLMPFEESQDPLESLFNGLHSKNWEKVLSEIVSLNYYGLLREKVQAKKEYYLVLGLWKHGALFLSPQEVTAQTHGISELMLKALLLINSRPKISKAELVQALWGYEYEPQRHDTMIYTLIHRLRGALGPFQDTLIGEDHHYRLLQNFKVLHLKTTVPESLAVEYMPTVLTNTFPWNIRQHRCVAMMNKGASWQVSDYAQEFSVSTMTALRDLSELVKFGVIKKYGRARSTTYAL